MKQSIYMRSVKSLSHLTLFQTKGPISGILPYMKLQSILTNLSIGSTLE